MNQKDEKLNLIILIDQLQDAAGHLRISLQRCSAITPKVGKENILIEFEALTSRFARIVDLLIHQIYRAIDAVEFIEGGTTIDILNRAEKRGLIDSLHEMRTLKNLRNDIAHEYISARIQLLHDDVFQYSPKVLELVARAANYCQQYR